MHEVHVLSQLGGNPGDTCMVGLLSCASRIIVFPEAYPSPVSMCHAMNW